MINAVKRTEVNAILLERHITGAHHQELKDGMLEIARTIDYSYSFGMRLHQIPSNSCTAVNECVQDLVNEETFQSEVLKVSIHVMAVSF